MDEKLLGQALQYHGVGLLYSLKAEHQEQPSASVLSCMDRKHHRDQEIKDAEFHKRVCTFIGRKSDMLFKPLSGEDKNRRQDHEIVDDAYAIMPALETFLDVPSHLRRGHFYRSLRPDDCVSGVVLSVLENGLRIQLLCVDKGCARDIDDLDIQAFCPVKELPKLYPNESSLDAFQEKDIVRGIVLVVSEESEKIIISLHEKAIPNKNTYPRIGLITEQEFPVHYRRKKQIEGMPFNEVLHSILGFNNTGNVKALVEQLGIQEDASYMRYLSRLHIPENEFAEGLRKWQSQKLAYHSVVQGVEMFKSGKFLEALQYFNRALQIDSENVEALVARGALYANKENFNHAIQDFEEALAINPTHNNAKKYLIETLLAFGKTCEDNGNYEEATLHYSRVLKLDPNRVEAKELIEACQYLMDECKNKKDKENEASILSKSADKLRQLIHEDKKEEIRMKKQRRQSSGSTEKSRRRKRSVSSSSSSSEDRRRHKKEPRLSINEKKRRKTETEGKRKSLDGNEEVKGGKDLNPKDKKSERKPQKVEATASGLLPVSSLEYFSKRMAIPGLDSPPPPSDAAADRPGKQRSHDDLQGRNAERPEENVKMLRRDDFLMAEREKFYRDNKDAYRKSPFTKAKSSSSSSSSSSRSSKSPSTSANKRQKSQRSSPKPQTEKSTLVTGIRELDMYLGGAKELFNRMHSKENPSSWALFSDLFSAGLRSSSQGQGSDSKNISHSKGSGFRSSQLSKDNDISTRASEDTSRRYQKLADNPEALHRGRQQDDRFGNTSRRDSAEEEMSEKLIGQSLEQGSSRNELYYPGDQGASTSRYQNKMSKLLKLVKSVEDSNETVPSAKSAISGLQQEREKTSGFREQDSSQERGKIDQMTYTSNDRNNVQPSKPLRQPADGVEKNFLRPQSDKYEKEFAGLHFRTEKQQKQDYGVLPLQTLQDGNQTSISLNADVLSSKSRGGERSKRSRSTEMSSRSADRSYRRSTSIERRRSTSRQRRRSTSREMRRSTSRERRRSTSRDKRRSTSRERRRSTSRERRRSISRDKRRSTSRERRRSTSRENRRSTSRERRRSTSRERRRSTSSERRRSTSRERRRSTSRERRRSTSRERRRSTSRERRRSTSSERRRSTSRERRRSTSRERRRSTSRERRSSTSRERRSTSTERRNRRSPSTERRNRRSKSTERSHRRSMSTERRQRRRTSRARSHRSTSRARRRKSRSVDKKRSRSRDSDQGNKNVDRQRRELITTRHGDRNGSNMDSQKYPVSETIYRRDQSTEEDKGKHMKFGEGGDFKFPVHDSSSGNRNIDNPETHYSKLVKLQEIGQEIERKLRKKLEQEEEVKIKKEIDKERRMHEIFKQEEAVLNKEKDKERMVARCKQEEATFKKEKDKNQRMDDRFKQDATRKKEKDKDRRLDNRFKQEEATLKTKIGFITKSKWDNNITQPERSKISRWDNKSTQVDQGKTSRWESNVSQDSDMKATSVDQANSSSLNTFPLVKHEVGSSNVPADRASTYSNLSPNVNRTHSKWDTVTNKKETTDVTAKSDEKITEEMKTSESLSDLEKFLIDLKEKKKKQWIAEGKMKKK